MQNDELDVIIYNLLEQKKYQDAVALVFKGKNITPNGENAIKLWIETMYVYSAKPNSDSSQVSDLDPEKKRLLRAVWGLNPNDIDFNIWFTDYVPLEYVREVIPINIVASNYATLGITRKSESYIYVAIKLAEEYGMHFEDGVPESVKCLIPDRLLDAPIVDIYKRLAEDIRLEKLKIK